MNIALEKREWRKQFKLQRKQMDNESYDAYSEQLNANLISYIKQVKPHMIKGFIPYAKEPNIWPFIHYCWQHSIPYIVPKCEQETATMRWYQIKHQDDLMLGAYSLQEPNPALCTEVIEEASIVLVPALAFTRQGERLGYGGGYYDRFYAHAYLKVKHWLGIAFSSFIVSQIPTEIHDFKCDLIVTDAGVIDCKEEVKEDYNGFHTF